MRFGLILSEAFTGLRRNASMVISVILVTFVSLTFVGAGALMQQQVRTMQGDWYDRVQVSIFLCTQDSYSASCAGAATDEDKAAIEGALTAEVPLASYMLHNEFKPSDIAYFQKFYDLFTEKGIFDKKVAVDTLLYKA